ncbi:peptidase domain-containing ABC transporter [Massilia sp. R2A-15]|uniref:peptidase domain-containing ABC transporter n=1 Tax=Massilia sp. R2A-15 TaxID=3064278 RepID=UPI002736FAAF|nr:peptidase domain-containing ABC transporter [Massilia sp. R2A-15]WLI90162.1 peptidase domain-containing ABC transporter [Massilia sp. R2A-15]
MPSSSLPLILQTEVAECGLACLAMVAGHHGFRTDLSTLRARFPGSLRGTSFEVLDQYAVQLNLSTIAYSLTLDELSQLKAPAILHWNLNHFVVLRRATARKITIHDPAQGVRELSYAEASCCFTGNALEFQRSTEFRLADERRKISLAGMIGKLDGWWQSLAQLFAMALGIEVLGLVTPKLSQYMVDEVLLTADATLRDVIALGMVLLLLTQNGLSLLRGWAILHVTTHLNVQWVSDVFSRLVKLPLEWFEKRQLGDVLSRFGSVGPIQDLLTTRAVGAVLDGMMATATLGMMLLYSRVLTAVVVGTTLLYALVRGVAYRPVRNASLEGMALGAKEQSCLMETIRAIGPIKLFGKEADRRARWLAMKIDTVNRNVRTQHMGLWFSNINSAIGALSGALVLWLGAGLVMEGAFTVGMLFALTSYSGVFSSRMANLINVTIDYKMLSLHCERLADIVLEATEPEIAHAVPVERLLPRLELVHVGFRYSAVEPWVLQDVNLVIEPGDSVAIAGVSGCGKSTLAKIILGSLKPTTGQVLYGGVPIEQLGMAAYRSMLAAVMQDDVLLAGSLRDNVCFSAERPDASRIVHCARLAQVHDAIERMPMGYETLIGDMGSSLSGGQKQRVLLARALYKEPKVLILDEATSALDVQQERNVNAAIGSLPMTRIIIAHRPETIASARRVVLLQGGLVAHDAVIVRPPEEREAQDSIA